jgi:hypothetical protein
VSAPSPPSRASFATLPVSNVVAAAAVDQIAARIGAAGFGERAAIVAMQGIVAVGAADHVGTRAADGDVVADAGPEDVVAAAAIQIIVAAHAGEQVASGAAEQGVGALRIRRDRRHRHVGAAQEVGRHAQAPPMPGSLSRYWSPDRASSPAPPIRRSWPAPPSSRSFAAPPSAMSSPSPPSRMSPRKPVPSCIGPQGERLRRGLHRFAVQDLRAGLAAQDVAFADAPDDRRRRVEEVDAERAARGVVEVGEHDLLRAALQGDHEVGAFLRRRD